MATLATAKAKWARKMAVAGPRWKRNVTDKSGAYASGMATFLGIPTIATNRVEAWKAGVGAITADDFAAAVRGKEDKWERKLLDAFRPPA